MELRLGSHVREHGERVGRLAGFEFEPATRCIRRIVFSRDGELGPHTMTRQLSLVTVTPQGIELRNDAAPPALPAVPDVVLLTRATRIVRGQDAGRLMSIDVDLADRRLLSVSGRRHWWSGRVTVPAADLDCSTPGEPRLAGHPHDTRAA
jgi:hypothetical protein